jgi:hypothetical protein
MHEPEHLSGPDFLDAFADEQLAAGLEINAAEFRRRAQQWRDDAADHDRAWLAHNTLEQALGALKRRVAAAFDVAMRITPTSSSADLHALRAMLATIADLQVPSVATPSLRDPRVLPMPGDQFWLPVEVTDVGYGRGGFDVELHAVADGVRLFDLAELPDRTADGRVQQWLRQATGVQAGDTPLTMHQDDAAPALQAVA